MFLVGGEYYAVFQVILTLKSTYSAEDESTD